VIGGLVRVASIGADKEGVVGYPDALVLKEGSMNVGETSGHTISAFATRLPLLVKSH
jgi:hypothetical protein